MASPCHHTGCREPAIAHITGGNLPRGGVNVCERHYNDVFEHAGATRTARLIHDDPQQTLFEMPQEGGDG